MSISTSPRFDHTEGTVARTIEDQTAKLPSDIFLWAAVASMAASPGVFRAWPANGTGPHFI